MDDIILITKTQKSLKERLQHIGDTILTGGVDNMEKYKYLVGQAHAIQLTLQDISSLLNKDKEQKNDGNVIDLGTTNGKGKSKN